MTATTPPPHSIAGAAVRGELLAPVAPRDIARVTVAEALAGLAGWLAAPGPDRGPLPVAAVYRAARRAEPARLAEHAAPIIAACDAWTRTGTGDDALAVAGALTGLARALIGDTAAPESANVTAP